MSREPGRHARDFVFGDVAACHFARFANRAWGQAVARELDQVETAPSVSCDVGRDSDHSFDVSSRKRKPPRPW